MLSDGANRPPGKFKRKNSHHMAYTVELPYTSLQRNREKGCYRRTDVITKVIIVKFFLFWVLASGHPTVASGPLSAKFLTWIKPSDQPLFIHILDLNPTTAFSYLVSTNPTARFNGLRWKNPHLRGKFFGLNMFLNNIFWVQTLGCREKVEGELPQNAAPRG